MHVRTDKDISYEIVDLGRQWLCAKVGRMKYEYKLSQVFGIVQLFAQRDEDGRICMFVAKVVDYFLFVGRPSCSMTDGSSRPSRYKKILGW